MKTKIIVEPLVESTILTVCIFQMASLNNAGCLSYSFEEMCNEIEAYSTKVSLQRDDEIQRVTVIEEDEPVIVLHFQNVLAEFPLIKFKKNVR